MLQTDTVTYCMSWELRNYLRYLNKVGYNVIRVEHVTTHKVAITARDRFR